VRACSARSSTRCRAHAPAPSTCPNWHALRPSAASKSGRTHAHRLLFGPDLWHRAVCMSACAGSEPGAQSAELRQCCTGCTFKGRGARPPARRAHHDGAGSAQPRLMRRLHDLPGHRASAARPCPNPRRHWRTWAGRPRACSHCADVSLSGQMTARTASHSTSAAVPGRLPRPAAASAARKRAGGQRSDAAPCQTSSGENACTCARGAPALAAASVRRYVSPAQPRLASHL